MEKTAILSEDNLYRYQLSRVWDTTKPLLLFIMLNPSTADSNNDDPTIRRLINFCKSWNYGGFYVGNLFAYRTPKPAELKKANYPIGSDNKKHIMEMLKKCQKVVYAYGNNQKEPTWLNELLHEVYCIKLSTQLSQNIKHIHNQPLHYNYL